MLRTNSTRNVAAAAAHLIAIAAALGGATAWAQGATVRYRVVLLDPLNDGPIAQALAINAGGSITGTAGSGAINPGQHVVVWEDAAINNIDPMFNLSEGQAISDSGVIAGMGWFCPPVDGACSGVIARALPGGEFMPIGSLGGGNGDVLDIAADGTFVGWAYDQNFVQRAFRYSEADGLQDLNPVPGFAGSGSANAINDDGTIVGFIRNSSLHQRAFRWSDGVLGEIGTLGGAASEANDINSAGVIVGWAKGRDGMPHAFRTDDAGAMVDIQSLPEAMWSVANLINDAGAIAGTLYDGQRDRLFVYTPTGGMNAIAGPIEDFHPMPPNDMNVHGQMVGIGITNMYQALAWFWSPQTGMRELGDLVAATGPAIEISGVGGINDAGQIAVTVTLAGTFTQRAARLDPVIPADINASGAVDVDDLIAVILAWGASDSPADVTGDGLVDVDDLIEVILNWS